jgi:arylsulfatase
MPALLLVLEALLAVTQASATEPEDPRPNILLIVADDLGYSDIGAYGGEIRTPSLDALADEGLQLTGYRTSPTCGPTRAMLMTGVDHHRAGLGTNAAALRRLPELRGRAGYEGFLNDRVVTLATLLNDAGYRTYMTGKWDLGGADGQRPTDRGFDRFFGLPLGVASHFSDAIGTFRPTEKAVYYDDDRPVDALPEDFYSATTYTDRILGYIDETPPGTPFFAYVAHTAPHWPLQVPDDWIDRYAGAYDEGWHAVRRQRYERQIELGLLPVDAVLPPMSPSVADWDSLLPAQRMVELKRIELYAAMVEQLDQQIGRLIERVRSISDRETVVVFLSDNGSEGNDIEAIIDNKYWIPATFDNRLDNMGRRGSYVWLGAGWGHATSSPFRLYKSFLTEGGIRAPAIVYSTDGRLGTGRRDATMTVMDIAPTLLEIAGVPHPGETYEGRSLVPVSGRSALPYLTGTAGDVHGDAVIGWELYGNRALFQGDWKAVLTWPPEGTGRWELYDLRNDPTESDDRAAAYPRRLERMVRAWQAYAEQNGVAVYDRDLGYGRYFRRQQ